MCLDSVFKVKRKVCQETLNQNILTDGTNGKVGYHFITLTHEITLFDFKLTSIT